MTIERLFFAADIVAAWPEILPEGRLIAKESRHITLAFLGSTDRDYLLTKLDQIPLPTWNTGLSGILQQWTFLPKSDPHVVAALPLFLEGEKAFLDYQQKLSQWLFDQKVLKSLEPHFLPHVSVARNPFDPQAWILLPCQIPFFISSIALYKSLGHSQYEKIWQKELLYPFVEIEHTADIAYKIRGQDYSQLALHAVLALAFSFPSFSRYLKEIPACHSLQEIVMYLNRSISEIDITEGIGLKAVSYHAHMENNEWTMIVDV